MSASCLDCWQTTITAKYESQTNILILDFHNEFVRIFQAFYIGFLSYLFYFVNEICEDCPCCLFKVSSMIPDGLTTKWSLILLFNVSLNSLTIKPLLSIKI